MTVKQQENGKWLVHINRKGAPRVRRTFNDQQTAEIFEREYVRGHISKESRQLALDGDRRTILELCDIWFRYHGVNLADGERRLANVRRLSEGLGNPVAQQLTPAEFLDYRYRRTQLDTDRITGKTFNNQHGYLNAVYRRLHKLKIIDYPCPIAEVEFIKLQERQVSYLSESEIHDLFDSLKRSINPSTWWVSQICIRTGARWGEAESLTRRQLQADRITYINTKSKRTRTVQIDPDFMAAMMEWIGTKSPSDRVFTSCKNAFFGAVERTDIKLPKGQLTHILRHTFSSYFMMRGGNILVLKEILGHADIKMTMRYAHLAPDHSADAVKLNPLANSGLAPKQPIIGQ